MAPQADAPARPPGRAPITRGWRSWFLIGLCFALGYGLTQRLVTIRFGTGLVGVQRFEVKSFPGSELDSLRRRFGDSSMQIRGDLDLLELERQQQQDNKAAEQRRLDMEKREAQEADGAAANGTGNPADPQLPDPAALPPADQEPAEQASPSPAATP